MPHHPLLASGTLLIAAVTVLMLSSKVWSLVRFPPDRGGISYKE
jgi:hypothetical protein